MRGMPRQIITENEFDQTQYLVDKVRKSLHNMFKRRPTMTSNQMFKNSSTIKSSKFSGASSTYEQQAMLDAMDSALSSEAEFILLCTVDAFLTNDFEHSLLISTQNFASIANTCLFEGNILRFRALASLKLFENELADPSEEDQKENFTHLTKAIESLENAVEIFEAEKDLV